MKMKSRIARVAVSLAVQLGFAGVNMGSVEGQTTLEQKVVRAEALLKGAADSAHTERMWKGAGWSAVVGLGAVGYFMGMRDSERGREECRRQGGGECWAGFGGAIAAAGGLVLGVSGSLGAIYQFAFRSAPERYYLEFNKRGAAGLGSEQKLEFLERALMESAAQQKAGRYIWSGIYLAGAAAGVSAMAANASKGKSMPTALIVGSSLSLSLGLWNMLGSSPAESAYETYQSEFKAPAEKSSALKLEDVNVGFTPDSQGNTQTVIGATFRF